MSGSQLAAELRELRKRTQLSLAGLAARTPYSKSSWERYLNGKKPVPRQAVEALCALAGEPSGRLLALWELADAVWSGRARSAAARDAKPPVEEPREERPAAPRGPRQWPAAPGVLAAAAVALAAALGLLMGRGTTPVERHADPPPSRAGCRGPECEGKDPARMGCGGSGMATTPVAGTASGGQRLEIRYGGPCRAVWAGATGLREGDRVVLTLRGGHAQELTADGPRGTGRYRATPMAAADDPAGARVCLEPASGGVRECFG
ncbi:helix-turn-helix domain-containing protein [Streptomyces sp. NPDC005408]|uniref:helix-turn-helix domain-containing protein n=1 Tax=Streptomyces sp. NPDC005408 TaxID=3155341 RepID=UPI00339E4016